MKVSVTEDFLSIVQRRDWWNLLERSNKRSSHARVGQLDRFSLGYVCEMDLTLLEAAMSAVLANASIPLGGTTPWSEASALAFWGIALLVAGATVRGLNSRSES